MNYSTASLLSISKLRPPFARSALLLFPFTPEGRINAGITVEMVVGEPAVAPGTGTVRKIYSELPRWSHSDPALDTTVVRHVVIDHGNEVTTTVGGMSSVDVIEGQTVYRGDRLGTLLTNQLFVAAALRKKAVNPLMLNAHWIPQNSNVVTGQGGKIRFAPDKLVRDISRGITVVLNGGRRYFQQLLAPAPLLVNIAFNGDGSKAGRAATGYTEEDYWNVYTPSDFYATVAYSCYYSGYEFSDAPVLHLQDFTDTASPVILQRVAPLFSAAGTAASWDAMLACWVGGYLGPVPYENTFILRNLPAGTYDLYLYANQGAVPNASIFYASVNAGLPTTLANNPIVTPVFAEGSNYVKFTLVVPTDGWVTFKAVGYLSGLQLQRV